MYIRKIERKNKDGSLTTYIQLAHNHWNPDKRRSETKVLFHLGRLEEVDLAGLERLMKSIARFLGPEEAAKLAASSQGLRFIESRPYGGAWLLDRLWNKTGIRQAIDTLLTRRSFAAPMERALFAMVANRALAPSSKLAMEDWVEHEAAIPQLPCIAVHQLYRAMDVLLSAQDELQHEVFFQVSHLMNLEVDLLYFDTTSTYFETEPEEEPDPRQSLRHCGYSKDHRPDLPQVVIGLAVTREGIPVRVWVWPGQTADMSVVPQVKQDLIGWKLGRVITVCDRGFVSEDNLKTLQRGGGHYIVGEKLRSGKTSVEDALSRPGRYKTVKDNLAVKEVIVGNGEARKRYILAHNPDQEIKDRKHREKRLDALRAELEQLGDLKGEPHTKAVCRLVSHVSYAKYLKLDAKGQPKLDKAKVQAEEKLDGKYLILTSDDTLSPEDVALGYKQLLEVESAFRTLKTHLELRPVYHRLDDRIRAHVLLCWLALLLVRVAEVETKQSWQRIRFVMNQMHRIHMEGPDGSVVQRTELTKDQQAILRALGLTEPATVLDFRPSGCPKTGADS